MSRFQKSQKPSIGVISRVLLRGALETYGGAPRVVEKTTNSAVRGLVNVLEKTKILSPKKAAQARVAIETQAIKDGNQVWRNKKTGGSYTVASSDIKRKDIKPTDLREKYLEDLAIKEIERRNKHDDEVLLVSQAFTSSRKPKKENSIANRILRTIQNQALESSGRVKRKNKSFEQMLEDEKEELRQDLTNPDRNPFLSQYPAQRKSVYDLVRGAAIGGSGVGGILNVNNILAFGNEQLERAKSFAGDVSEDAQKKSVQAQRFIDDIPEMTQRKIRQSKEFVGNMSQEASRRINQKAQDMSNDARKKIKIIIEVPEKAKRQLSQTVSQAKQRMTQPIKISVPKFVKDSEQAFFNKPKPMLKRGLKKMHTPMKSVSVPYTRTLTDDSVPSPKKFMHKMMGGKTGRMGKELTGADGVKGRYFQKGQRMIKFYEVDKPHAPQMRSMGMGKLQKGKIATRMRIPSEGVLRGTMVDTMRGTSGKLRTTIKPSEYKSEVLHALFDAMPETSGMLRTTIKPKKSTRMTVASKPTKGYLSAYTKDRLKRGGELEDIRTAMAGTPTFHILSEPQYKGFKNFSQWKSQNETPRDLNRILTNAVRNKGIASRVKINAGDYNTPIVLPMMKKRATRKMHEITDDNYYGNQKPRKKDEFRKNQGAFINGRKLKY